MTEPPFENQEISEFLKNYRKEYWDKCIEGVLLYGIRKIKSKYRIYPKYKDLMRIVGVPDSPTSSITERLNSMKRQIESLSRTISDLDPPENPKKQPETTEKKQSKKSSFKPPKYKCKKQNIKFAETPHQQLKIPSKEERKDWVSMDAGQNCLQYPKQRRFTPQNQRISFEFSKEIQEPNTIPMNEGLSKPEFMKIAEDFLKNPLTQCLRSVPSTMPTSPENKSFNLPFFSVENTPKQFSR